MRVVTERQFAISMSLLSEDAVSRGNAAADDVFTVGICGVRDAASSAVRRTTRTVTELGN